MLILTCRNILTLERCVHERERERERVGVHSFMVTGQTGGEDAEELLEQAAERRSTRSTPGNPGASVLVLKIAEVQSLRFKAMHLI